VLYINGEDIAYTSTPTAYQYTTLLHWYLSQMTVGNEAIPNLSTQERVFNIFALVVGFVLQTIVVCLLSATLVDARLSKMDEKSQMQKLHRLFKENGVSQEVALRVWKQVNGRMRQNQIRLAVKDVPVLDLLSHSTLSKLQLEIFGKTLMIHPLFRVWNAIDRAALASLTMDGVETIHLVLHDDLFVAGAVRHDTACLVNGTIAYRQFTESSLVSKQTEEIVGNGTWFCEAALWTNWTTVGQAEAQAPCHILSVSTEGVMKAMGVKPIIATITYEYGKHFHFCVSKAKPPDSAWPTDLHVPFTDFGDMLLWMPSALQIAIGAASLRSVSARNWTRSMESDMDLLRDEVSQGKCVILLNQKGDLERIVFVVALDLTDAERQKRKFVQLGKYEAGKFEAGCQLPGGKQNGSEFPSDAMRRLLSTSLKPLFNVLTVKDVKRVDVWQDSGRMNMRTRYVKTICSAELTAEIEAPHFTWQSGTSSRGSYHPPLATAGNRINHGGGSFGSFSDPMRLQALSTLGAERRPHLNRCKDILEGKYIYVFQDEGRVVLHAWLDPEELDFLSTRIGQDSLDQVVTEVGIDPILASGMSSREIDASIRMHHSISEHVESEKDIESEVANDLLASSNNEEGSFEC